ncbi:MAG: zf-HC2 domain-containing protein [Longimicrobiales bacterium]|nr:zf-HC2 domain-containing protein [Longimicrobiales bacterium]
MHPTTGELRAFLDDELSPERSSTIGDHLAGCASCRSLRRRLQDEESVVREAMAQMIAEPDLSRARREIRRRTTLGGRGTPRRSELLRTAAVLFLLLGGITAALPGSPVRAWLLDLWDGESIAPRTPAAVDAAPGETPGRQGPDSGEGAAVRIDPSEGAVRIELSGVREGTRVRVRFVEGGRAGVSASGAGAFRTGAGYLGVRDPGDTVTVEVPRGVSVAEIRSDERILLRKTGDSLDFPTVTPEADGDAFVLTIPDGFRDGG